MLFRRRVTPQRARLPNGQSLLGRYERVSRRNLPRSVTGRRTRRIRPRKNWKNKKGWKLFRDSSKVGPKAPASTVLLKKVLSLGAKAINSDIGKKLVDEWIKHAPGLYRLETSKKMKT